MAIVLAGSNINFCTVIRGEYKMNEILQSMGSVLGYCIVVGAICGTVVLAELAIFMLMKIVPPFKPPKSAPVKPLYVKPTVTEVVKPVVVGAATSVAAEPAKSIEASVKVPKKKAEKKKAEKKPEAAIAVEELPDSLESLKPGEDGKVPLSCPKCGMAYRVYPNREWYTCSKDGTKMYLVKPTAVKKD
jgi:hypothetical protein